MTRDVERHRERERTPEAPDPATGDHVEQVAPALPLLCEHQRTEDLLPPLQLEIDRLEPVAEPAEMNGLKACRPPAPPILP